LPSGLLCALKPTPFG